MKRMSLRILTLGLALALLPALLLAQAHDKRDFAGDVRHGFPTGADASPTAADSYVNNYLYQDEQINIEPSDGVIKVLRTDQKMLVNDFITTVVPCKQVNPRELRGPFRVMTRKEGGDADVLQDKEKKEYFLHIVCPRFQLPYIQECIAALDEPWVQERQDGSGEMYYKAKFRDIRKIQNVTRWYVGPESFYPDGSQKFIFDDLNNAMYYNDQPALMGLQNWALSQVDIPPNQVNLEVTVYEVDMNHDGMLGLDWLAGKNGPGRNLLELGHYASYSRSESRVSGGDRVITDGDKRFTFANVNAVAASQFLDFVQSKGYVREVVKTNVTVKSGDSAIVEAVDSVVHFESDTTKSDVRASQTVADAEGDAVDVTLPKDRGRELKYREADDKVGVRIELKPYVGLESLELDVKVDVSSVNGYTPKGNPLLGVRQVRDYARLINGEPFVLAGMERETVVRRKNGFPLMHKLPVLGWLFGNEGNMKRKTQMVVVVKPTTMIGAESDLEMPADARTVVSQARGVAEIEFPSSPFGFDQWLFD